MEQLYNSYFFNEFYEKEGGGNYMNKEVWHPHFENIAEKIIANFSPKTVLDAGCACGYLVEALRNRGVEAYGVDISNYAIEHVSPEIKEFCCVHNIADPLPSYFPQKYDLVVTIEVLEHLYEEDGKQAITNLCSYSDKIIFTSTPDDISDQSHVNVQKAEYWCRIFAQNSFYRNLFQAMDWICPWAMFFEKRTDVPNLINEYERKLRIYTFNLEQQTQKKLEEQKSSIKQNTNKKNRKLKKEITAQAQTISCLEQQLDYNGQLIHLLEKKANETQLCVHQRESEQAESYKELEDYKSQCKRLQEMIEAERKRADSNYALYQSIENASWWKLTKPFRRIQDRIRYRNKKKVIVSINSPINDTVANSHSTLLSETYPIIPKKSLVPQHTDSVDIIICVHNAYEDVKRCIESVFQYTNEPYRLIIVDDGSSDPTKDYLKQLKADIPSIYLIRNETGNGYTKAANMGLRASHAEYCVLLNSDTIVTEKWLDKMIFCANSDPNIGIVGPLSNTASWQSVPEIFDSTGDWCHNELPSGCTVADMGYLVEKNSAQLYTKVPLLNGFCLLLTRSTINRNGYMDENTFSQGFGEEDDYNLRAGKLGIKLAIADDTYIFHAQSKSYSDAKRLELCKDSGKKLRDKHGDLLIDQSVCLMKDSFVLQGIRSRIKVAIDRKVLIESAKKNWEGKKILVILPIAEAGGGANVLIQESEKLVEMGIDVYFYNLTAFKNFFEESYPNLDIPVIYDDSLANVTNYAADYDAVCCTLYTAVKYLKPVGNTSYKKVYYVQDFEPYFFQETSTEYSEALESYRNLHDWTIVTKTMWNKNKVEKVSGSICNVIGPSVNLELFRPRKMDTSKEIIKICAMVRPNSSRRAPHETMNILREISKRYAQKIEILIFGCDCIHSEQDRNFMNSVPTDFPFRNLGKLTPEQMSQLLSDSDIFADFSSFQAMGLTAMEAMACGCAVIVPQNGGAKSFAKDQQNSLVVDTANTAACIQALETLITNSDLRKRLALQAISDICEFYPEKSAYYFLKSIFGQTEEL